MRPFPYLGACGVVRSNNCGATQASYAARNKFISGGADDADDSNITMTTLSFIFQASYHLYLGSNFILLVFDRDDCHCDGLQ